MWIFNKKRTISPAIASVVLIGVAISGSIAAGSAMFKQSEIANISTKVDLIDVVLLNMNVANKSYFAVTIKNSGTTSLSFISVGFLDDDGNSQNVINNLNLNPGQQWGSYIIADISVIPDRKYILFINATTNSGSHYQWANSIVARG